MKKYLVLLAAIAVFFCGQAFGGVSDLIVDANFVKDKIGKPGWVRLSAWIWVFSSTLSTTALVGGSM